MAELIRGTTPTLMYTFSDIDPANISYAYLLLKQNGCGGNKIEKYLADASVTGDTQTVKGNISFTLSQADTLSLTSGKECQVSLDWKLTSGLRGRSRIASFSVSNSGKNEVV